MKMIRMLAVVVAVLSFVVVGCQKGEEHPSGEHPSKEAAEEAASEHPAEHPE